ncbi:MAG TPA: hypothetical protein VJ768_06145 [Anaerolineales bacterium]|nr:hypothetical protein [Anaerolineales bacterium]
MTKVETLRVLIALSIFLLGSLQAWDSDVPDAGLLIVFVVTVAIALPAVAISNFANPSYLFGSVIVSVCLLVIARLASPIPLPGLFIIIVPAAMGLIFPNILAQRMLEEDSGSQPPEGSGSGSG